MNDRRLTPANGRVAATGLRGQIQAERFVDGVLQQVIDAPFLHREPRGSRDRQLLWGDAFRVYDQGNDWVFGQSLKDGYVGYVHHPLTEPQTLTHRVDVRTTWAYPVAGFKQPALHELHFNSFVCVVDHDGKWAQISVAGGELIAAHRAFVPVAHLAPIADRRVDPVAVAAQFLGTPYVWAGNSGFGIDCSGLVQAACHACGVPCPGDSDLQEAALGETVPEGTQAQSGDLFFWRGHVAMAVDSETMIHANAHHMSVSYEPISDAILRIEEQGDGPVTRHARINWDKP
ncbi:NlpC/P60 family protein [Pelagimonas varians]|uniref:Gamma-D-glutamyl-L-lysine endopeptidase n=1 Tax=Pelagimonas varians TaxID=696760 RepID=A0A238K9X1_9RHOB|nr:NlpC/P60 family protein [Pelagimonas varians]PYG31132.1 NlpC/P60 family protein [Pelagimonas varians]SMX39700.1 Gamma-D-glutamyl-L-lysine endopeptidase [Pelagimonas varians]